MTVNHRLGYRGCLEVKIKISRLPLNLSSHSSGTKSTWAGIVQSAFACLLYFATSAAVAAEQVEALTRNNFHNYLRALAEQDFDALDQYYSKDIVAKFGDLVLDHAAVMQYEKGQAAFMDSTMEVRRLVGDDHNIVIEAMQVRTMLSDAPGNSVKAGTAFHSHLIIFYTLEAGKISALEVFNLSSRQVD